MGRTHVAVAVAVISAAVLQGTHKLCSMWVDVVEDSLGVGRLGPGVGDGPGTPPSLTAVVVLGYKMHGDGVPWPLLDQRIQAAGHLLESGLADIAVFTGGRPRGMTNDLTEAGAMLRRMLQCFPSLDSKLTLLEQNSTSTYENAVNTLQLLTDKVPGIRAVVVVTNRFHQLRALWSFEAAARRWGLKVVAARAESSLVEQPLSNVLLPRIAQCPGSEYIETVPTASPTSRPWSLENSPVWAVDGSKHTLWRAVEVGDWVQLDFAGEFVCAMTLRAGPLAVDLTQFEVRVELASGAALTRRLVGALVPGEQRVFLLEGTEVAVSARLTAYAAGAVVADWRILRNCPRDYASLTHLNETTDPIGSIPWPGVADLSILTLRSLVPWIEWGKTWCIEVAIQSTKEVLAIMYYKVRHRF